MIPNKKLLAVAAAIGLLATILLGNYMAGRERELLGLSEPVRVVVASEDVPRNGIVQEDAVAFTEVPRKFVQPGAIGDIADVVGKRLAIGLQAGAQVQAAHLAGAYLPSLSYLVQNGARAVTVAVDDVTGVGGLLQPGDTVDVTAVFEVGAAGGTEQALARTLLQNIKVLAVASEVGARRLGGETAAVAEDPDDAPPPRTAPDVRNVTLLVQNTDANVLILAQQVGAITLVLRGPDDTATTATPSTLLRQVTGLEAPVRTPATPTYIERRDGKR